MERIMLPASRVLFLALCLIVGPVHAQLGYGGENKIPLKKPDPPKSAPMAPPPAAIIRPEPAPMAPPPAPMKKPFRVCSETQSPSDDNCVRMGPTASGTIRGHTDDIDDE
jgi:hypothetical protein